MPDVIEKVRGSLVQHGKGSNRIYLMKLVESQVRETIADLDRMAAENGYTKITAKVPEWASAEFEANGYKSEATVPGFYNGTVSVSFMGKYFSSEREREDNSNAILNVLSAACQKRGGGVASSLPPEFEWRIAEEEDAEQISRVYREVFKTYPFPILEADYVRETMRDNVVYFCVLKGDEIVSVASSEMDVEAKNVEMTDFATPPAYRGHGFGGFLLAKMEDVMRTRSIKTAYTIARAVSYGMNITFAKLDYKYGGTLTNNTDICGSTESMNIWHKQL